MKTRKLKFLIPVFAIVFALTSAFTTSASTDVDDYFATGYIDAPTPCEQAVNCSTNSSNPVCKQNGDTGPQAFGKVSANYCPTVLYKP